VGSSTSTHTRQHVIDYATPAQSLVMYAVVITQQPASSSLAASATAAADTAIYDILARRRRRRLRLSQVSLLHFRRNLFVYILYIFIRLDGQQTAHNTQLENTIKHNHTRLKER